MRGHGVPRRIVVAGGVVVVLVTGFFVVRRLFVHDTARAVDPSAALDAYRHSSTSTSSTIVPIVVTVGGAPTTTVAPAATPPPPGVYRYTTSGSEHIDVLGGATHLYPKGTTLTVTPGGCGAHLRWDVLKERREEWDLCTTPSGMALGTHGVQLHMFFGHGDVEPFDCNRTVVLSPTDRTPSPPIPLDCALMGAEWKPVWEVVGPEEQPVGETTVPVMHVRETITKGGHYYEHTVVDWWLDAHGLPVLMTTAKSSRSNSGLVGDVVYNEHYRAVLQSLTPMR